MNHSCETSSHDMHIQPENTTRDLWRWQAHSKKAGN